MKLIRVYIDTSVIGGCFDPEFAKWSNGLMKDFRLGHFKPVVSDLVTAEIRNAPARVQEIYSELIEESEIIVENQPISHLVIAYKKHKPLPAKFENDMTHIALATVFEVDLLVSWNFKHIVHFDKIKKFNLVNQKSGDKPIQILSPREVTHYAEDI